jgi:hypothetical protein
MRQLVFEHAGEFGRELMETADPDAQVAVAGRLTRISGAPGALHNQ